MVELQPIVIAPYILSKFLLQPPHGMVEFARDLFLSHVTRFVVIRTIYQCNFLISQIGRA